MIMINMVLYWLADVSNKIILEPRLKVVSSVKEGIEIENTLIYLGFKAKRITEEIKEDDDII